jgi:phage antirepressor YoqD-like protein
MQCISCQANINPQWTHAIETNVCPICGRAVVDEHLKKLLVTLRETMEKLQAYPEQLNDWLLSNHNYIKTDSENLINYISPDLLAVLKKVKDDNDFQERKKFTVKVKTEHGEEEVQAETLQSEEKTNDFFRRAEVIKKPRSQAPLSNAVPSFQSPAQKTQELKSKVNQIKKMAASGLGTNNLVVSPELLEAADPVAIAEYQEMIGTGDVIHSALTPDVGSDDDAPSHILAANQAIAAARGGNSSANAADLLKLQQMQLRSQQSRQDFESGANRGKGGFSRSG